MSLLPVNIYTAHETAEETEQTSYTYKLDIKTGRIIGYTNRQEAVTQAILKLFYTERFAYVIYPQNYGIELENLLGQNIPFVTMALQSRIEEAIREDDRVLGIETCKIEQTNKNTLSVYCVINTVFGNVEIGREVAV